MKIDIKKIKKSIDKIDNYNVVKKTPLQKQEQLSLRYGNNIFLKREDLQLINSFKIRGAMHKFSKLTKTQLKNGVIAASAGNHAQGVAMSAKKFKCKAKIIMPDITPAIKVKAVKRLGAEVVLHGKNIAESLLHAFELEKSEKLTFIHPYDDLDVISGQGTIGKEIMEAFQKPIHAIFCCVGGGGLMTGIAAYIKAINPSIKIIGVEALGAEAMTKSLKSNKRITLKQVALFAEGAAVKRAGIHTFNIAKKYVDEMLVVDNDSICAAIKDTFEDSRVVLEPAGALAVAGMKQYLQKNKIENENIICIASGANLNFDRLRFVAERAEIGEQREAIIAVSISEKPGAFKNFCELIGNRNITEFNYRYSNSSEAQIFTGVSISKISEVKSIIKSLESSGLKALDLTSNELAKSHLRHLVGGHAPAVKNELIYRFEFPERPGALMNFLNLLNEEWNITLFHYRNHGADQARVLVGIQVPSKQEKAFKKFLSQLSYPYWNESSNLGYNLFLGNK
jgi:threonine dehydratase